MNLPNLHTLYKRIKITLLLITAMGALEKIEAFNHPGIFNNAGDLNRAKANVAASTEPWRSAWERLNISAAPNSSYTVQGPFSTVGRNPDVNRPQFEQDCAAAYYNAVEFWMTGNTANSAKAITILNGYSGTLTSITGTDARLLGFNFCMLINAAELIRYGNAGWSSANITQFSNWLTNTVYPLVQGGGPFGWGGACNNTMMCIGVFNDNMTQFNGGYLNYTGSNAGLGSWSAFFNTSSAYLGEPADTYRDEGHGQLDVECCVLAAEICRNCGTGNLYNLNNNVLLNACEYVAKYNLLHHVPWTDMENSGVSGISSESRGNFIPFYECAYAEYVNILGLSAPYTTQVVNAQGVETWGTGDPGIGTLTHCQSSRLRPSPAFFMEQQSTIPFYIVAGNNGTSNLSGNSQAPQILEAFQEVIQGNGYSALKSLASGKYLTDPNPAGGGALVANSTTVGIQQEFKVVDYGERTIGFASAINGEYMGALTNGTVACTVGFPFYNAFNCQYVGTTLPPVVTALNGNTYKMIDVRSSLALDVFGQNTGNGGIVDQYGYNGGNNQRWTFTNIGNGVYNVTNVNSGLLLDVAGKSTAPGGLIDQYSPNGGGNQQWMVQYIDPADPSSTYVLTSMLSGLSLDDPGNSIQPTTQFDQWLYAGGTNDQFQLGAP